MKEQGVNTISKGILVHLCSKVARLFFTSTKESKTPHITLLQRVRTQISPQHRTHRSSDHSSNWTQEEHVLGSLSLIVERASRVSRPMPFSHNFPGKDNISKQLTQENLNFARDFSVPDPFEISPSKMFFEPAMHRYSSIDMIYVKFPDDIIS